MSNDLKASVVCKVVFPLSALWGWRLTVSVSAIAYCTCQPAIDCVCPLSLSYLVGPRDSVVRLVRVRVRGAGAGCGVRGAGTNRAQIYLEIVSRERK